MRYKKKIQRFCMCYLIVTRGEIVSSGEAIARFFIRNNATHNMQTVIKKIRRSIADDNDCSANDVKVLSFNKI